MKKMCNYCGNNIGDTSKQFNRFCCPKCGKVLDRDINAAKNIRDTGLVFINKSIKKQEEKKG